ncbi:MULTISPECIES: lipase family protein [unclassified Granulicatella]|uniref:lipase family protein n=1 Tax=unclassified Granulicatella TaxID=2630493 RepID=UPI00066D0AE9|nr:MULTISPECIES: hypothetical protein [unclassified Granulicatella]
MSDLKTFDNLYTSLSQSAYEDRPRNFKERSSEDIPGEINYAEDYEEDKIKIDGGKNLPNNGIVYVHKDKTIQTVTERMPMDDKFEYEKGLLSNEKDGFNSYFLTDTPELNTDTKNAYLAVKGSDAPSLKNLDAIRNDWLGNNYPFTMNDEYIIQGKLVEEALHAKLAELREKAPNAKLNITGHSLGSIASVQGAAHLSVEELDQIGEIVVLNGPDTLKSLRKSGVSEEVIQILNEKVTYYVNPFDIVSMLNRNTDEQLGKVKVIVPFNFATTFENPNSHDFGEYRVYSDGTILEATENFFPAYLKAGEKLSKLLNKYIELIKEDSKNSDIEGNGHSRYFLAHLVNGGLYYSKFMKEYQEIIEETKLEVISWGRKNIQLLQGKLLYANGAERIKLRSQLILTLSHLSRIESDDKVSKVLKLLEENKRRVKMLTESAYKEAANVTLYLEISEFQAIISEFNFEENWDESKEQLNRDLLKAYLEKIYKFSDTLFYATEKLEEIDREQGELFV